MRVTRSETEEISDQQYKKYIEYSLEYPSCLFISMWY